MAIYFYKIGEEYGCFSNFAHYGFEAEGRWWKTSEHYFQAKKFEGTVYEEQVRLSENPMEAAKMGRDRSLPLRSDWEEVKDEIMRQAVLMKFSQNADIREILLNTGEQELIENTTGDYYWGCGSSGEGKNMLGKILMEIRRRLKEE